MIVDTSAIIAILRLEEDAVEFAKTIQGTLPRKISAANYFESAIVIDRSGDAIASRRFDELIRESEITIVPFDGEQAAIARAAYRDFGKGSGHPAQLNFGDCFSYALSKVTREPLLFKGCDFLHTDVATAMPQRRSVG